MLKDSCRSCCCWSVGVFFALWQMSALVYTKHTYADVCNALWNSRLHALVPCIRETLAPSFFFPLRECLLSLWAAAALLLLLSLSFLIGSPSLDLFSLNRQRSLSGSKRLCYFNEARGADTEREREMKLKQNSEYNQEREWWQVLGNDIFHLEKKKLRSLNGSEWRNSV
jgi:hypothetical protein